MQWPEISSQQKTMHLNLESKKYNLGPFWDEESLAEAVKNSKTAYDILDFYKNKVSLRAQELFDEICQESISIEIHRKQGEIAMLRIFEILIDETINELEEQRS